MYGSGQPYSYMFRPHSTIFRPCSDHNQTIFRPYSTISNHIQPCSTLFRRTSLEISLLKTYKCQLWCTHFQCGQPNHTIFHLLLASSGVTHTHTHTHTHRHTHTHFTLLSANCSAWDILSTDLPILRTFTHRHTQTHTHTHLARQHNLRRFANVAGLLALWVIARWKRGPAVISLLTTPLPPNFNITPTKLPPNMVCQVTFLKVHSSYPRQVRATLQGVLIDIRLA